MDVVSLGSSTHTRVDSAAKHIRQCKIHERLMQVWHSSGGQAQEMIHRQKNKYATQKDDLVLNVNESLSVGYAPTDAYPSVLSNFTSLKKDSKTLIMDWYAKSTPQAFLGYQQEIAGKQLDIVKNEPQTQTLPYFRAQGYALGRAEASMRSGDTVFSVLIGGQMTVRNGHFPMRPGQLVHWYFDFEEVMFDEDGRRRHGTHEARPESKQGKRLHEETNAESQCSALPKPYVLSKFGSEHYGDKIRIFAKCIAGGGAHQKVDIMLMTQSL
jgi:hypothetical protein